MRFKHRLSRNHTTRAPAAHVFVDTEAWVRTVEPGNGHEIHSFRLGCATYVRLEQGRPTRRQTLDFDRTDRFWGWLRDRLNHRRPVWVWAHNLIYDWTLLGGWGMMEDGWLDCPNPCIEDPPTVLRCHTGAGRLVALDSLNWWRCPLADLGRSVGIPKLEMPDHLGTDSEWLTYCRRDVEILERAVLRLISLVRDHDLGVLQTTAPAQAMAAWRHKWPESLPIIHDDMRAYNLERAAYVGGRCEVFRVGTTPGPVYVCDTNSLLPSVMADHLYPGALLGYREEGGVRHLRGLISNYAVCATVRIHSDDEVYPVRRSDGVVHARGDFWTALTTPDLARALARDHVVSVGQVSWYGQSDLFGGFVDYFWRLRVQARAADDTVTSDLCKLLMNSIHGKLGQRAHRWQHDPCVPCLAEWGRFYGHRTIEPKDIECRGIAGRAQVKCGDEVSPHSFPAISAHVTAYGRERMDRVRAVCPAITVYYQGEDSLHVSDEGLSAIRAAVGVRDRELGCLRLDTVAESAEYRGRYNYTLGGRHKIAGVPRSAEPLPSGGFRLRQFDRAGTVVAKRPDGTIHVATVEMSMPHDANVGVVREDGWVDPYHLTPESER